MEPKRIKFEWFSIMLASQIKRGVRKMSWLGVGGPPMVVDDDIAHEAVKDLS